MWRGMRRNFVNYPNMWPRNRIDIITRYILLYPTHGGGYKNNIDGKNLPLQHNVSYRGNLLKLDWTLLGNILGFNDSQIWWLDPKTEILAAREKKSTFSIFIFFPCIVYNLNRCKVLFLQPLTTPTGPENKYYQEGSWLLFVISRDSQHFSECNE